MCARRGPRGEQIDAIEEDWAELEEGFDSAVDEAGEVLDDITPDVDLTPW